MGADETSSYLESDHTTKRENRNFLFCKNTTEAKWQDNWDLTEALRDWEHCCTVLVINEEHWCAQCDFLGGGVRGRGLSSEGKVRGGAEGATCRWRVWSPSNNPWIHHWQQMQTSSHKKYREKMLETNFESFKKCLEANNRGDKFFVGDIKSVILARVEWNEAKK